MNTSTDLDASDPLARYRDLFLREDDVVSYLDGNSLGRPLVASVERVQRFLTEQWGGRLIRGWGEGWLDLPLTIGDELGRVALGAAPGQVSIGDSTTVLLYKLIRAAVEARPGRTEILIDRENFPTDRFVVEGIAAERGLTVTWLGSDAHGPSRPAKRSSSGKTSGLGSSGPGKSSGSGESAESREPSDSGVTVEMLAGAISDNTAVVVVSHVAYRSGYLADVRAITSLVHDAGALVVWDLSHSVGVVPTLLDDWGVDLATGCSYKYLNGGPGSPAFAYVRADLQGELRQPIQGWLGSKDPFAMGQGFEVADGIRSLASGTPPVIGMLAMQDMIALLDEVGLEAVRSKSVALTEFAIELADELLPDARLASPRDADRRGSHITLDRDGFDEIVPKLWAQGVIPDFRGPNGIRIGLSPLSTSFAELEIGMFAIRHPGA